MPPTTTTTTTTTTTSGPPPPPPHRPYPTPHSRWRALSTRDPAAHTSFVYAVRSTRIYCRPTCPARLARRANVAFFDDAASAAAALPGYRACKRCRPDVDDDDGDGDSPGKGEDRGGRRAAEWARAVLEREGGAVKWGVVAGEVGRAPRYLHGVFRRAFGVTPGVYAAGVRERRRRRVEEEEEERGSGGLGCSATPPELVDGEGSLGGAVECGAEVVVDDAWGEMGGLFADVLPGFGEGGTAGLSEAWAVEGMEKLFDGASLEPWEHLVQWDAVAFAPHAVEDTGNEEGVAMSS
ncbi:dna repair and transcription factor protein [Diplodia corticola]|uniref:Dna repair and transcription factor protein n=1 Tax=Diplodia corticola TaxID=236234 RepID=A0A1J9QIY6_9PEZI|nr:dna repair and transcription factor protein [Diplodia corticola]OJD28822.1 dna repair and transcription factor protein [Diplodia corticola]